MLSDPSIEYESVEVCIKHRVSNVKRSSLPTLHGCLPISVPNSPLYRILISVHTAAGWILCIADNAMAFHPVIC
jgi:hypothetical protein